MTTREQARIQVLNGVIERKVSMAEAAADEGERAPRVATAGGVSKGGSCRGGETGAGPSTATSPETQERVLALAKGRWLQPLAELLASGRASICPAPPSGGSCWRAFGVPAAAERASAICAGSATPRGCAGSTGAGTLVGGPDAHRGRGRRHGDGPLRPIQSRRTGMLKEDRRGVPPSIASIAFQRSPREVESRDEQLRGRRDPTQFARGSMLTWPIHPRPRVARGTPSRTGWSRRCASRASPALRRPTGCSGTSCRDTIGSRRGAGPAGTGLSPTAAGRLP